MDSRRPFRPLILAGALAVASAAYVVPVQAERGPGGGPEHGPDPARRLEHMTERLGLEDDQVARVREVLEDSHARAREIRAAERGARRAAMTALREDTDARLAAILTPAQMQLLEDGREAQGEHRKMRRAARREAGFERLMERLELAPSQIEPVREILDAGRARGRDIAQAARAEDMPREALRDQLDAVRAETASELAGVLSPAQLEVFLALPEGREGRGAPRRRDLPPESR
ncbi:MAG: hypothetical protein V2J24_04185 [Pseudomonadales bacterium]|jgi:hypothetical protein|nr:hypothetical protein [Pseudomonadales bacterium]